MPVKPLPKKLVSRLIDAAPRIKRLLGKMKNIDHRAARFRTTKERDTTVLGARVREMNVSRNYPHNKVVIKRTHGLPAKETIELIESKVRCFNQSNPQSDFVLLAPKAYVIGEYLVAMEKTNKPTVLEILYNQTLRGICFWRKISKKYKISKEQFEKAVKEITTKTDIEERNIFFLGVKKGKMQFMPLVDAD